MKSAVSLLLEEFNLKTNEEEAFVCYLRLLKEWNKKINLTAIRTDQEIILKHFYDSLLVTKVWNNFAGKELIDIGTGAGFPGIPLKIIHNDLKVVLCDSLLKRLNFLKQVILDLNLSQITTLHSRAEDLGQDVIYREKFDLVTARAVARLPILLELCLPLLKTGGLFFAFKGPEADNELQESERALNILGAKVESIEHFQLKELGDQRTIIVFQKTKATPKKYPRRPGLPQKHQL